MNPKQDLFIYEIRAKDELALKIFDETAKKEALGNNLKGLHWEDNFAFLFFTENSDEVINNFIKNNVNLKLCQTHNLKYEQWQDGANAKSFKIGDLSFIQSKDEKPDNNYAIINPGLAFGFGGHETTYSCLEFIKRICQKNTPLSALDLGCGTGILAIAAAKWGVKNITALDYSHLAFVNAQENVILNNLENKIKVHHAKAQEFALKKAEVLLANIHLSLQEELFKLKAFHHRKHIIISGLLPKEGEIINEKILSLNYKITDQKRTDRWTTVLFTAC